MASCDPILPKPSHLPDRKPLPPEAEDDGWVDVISGLGTLHNERVQIQGFKPGEMASGEGTVLIDGIEYAISILGKGNFKEAYVARITHVGEEMLQRRFEEQGLNAKYFPVGRELVIAHQKRISASTIISPSTLRKFHDIPYIIAPRPVEQLDDATLAVGTDRWQVSSYCGVGDGIEFIEGLPDGPSFEARKKWVASHRNHILGMLIYQLAKAHEAGIALRDIKTANVFVSEQNGDYTFHLADVDLCIDFDKYATGAPLPVGGSPAFMSKDYWEYFVNDRVSNSPEYQKVLFASDVWALGLTIYQLFYFSMLSHQEILIDTRREYMAKKVKGVPPPPEPDWGHTRLPMTLKSAGDFLQWMLTNTSRRRPTAQQLWLAWKAVNPDLAHKIEVQNPFGKG